MSLDDIAAASVVRPVGAGWIHETAIVAPDAILFPGAYIGPNVKIGSGCVIGPNASSVAVKKATADFNVAGIALDASTTSGAIIRILLLPGAFFRTAAG